MESEFCLLISNITQEITTLLFLIFFLSYTTGIISLIYSYVNAYFFCINRAIYNSTAPVATFLVNASSCSTSSMVGWNLRIRSSIWILE